MVSGGKLASSGGRGASGAGTARVKFVADTSPEAGCASLKLAAVVFVVRSVESGPFFGGVTGLVGECVAVGRNKNHVATAATAHKSKRPVRNEPVTAPVYRLRVPRKEGKQRPEDWGSPKVSHGPTRTYTKPRFGVENRPIFGNTVARLPLSTPNQEANVAKYWSQAVVGIQRPVLVSSGPLTASVGKRP